MTYSVQSMNASHSLRPSVGCRALAFAATVVLGGGAATRVAHAQWTVTNLHPPGATESKALAASDGRQVGYVAVGGQQHASIWNGSPTFWIDLNPPEALSSVANAICGTRQSGQVVANGSAHASAWTGTASSWIDLNPSGSTGSAAYGVSGTQQVGSTRFDVFPRASLWSGTAGSWVDLQPIGSSMSVAIAASETQQVGYTGGFGWSMPLAHAVLWSGTAASWIDLHPVGFGVFRSAALAIGDGQQGGFVQIGDPTHQYWGLATIWSGTAASWVLLHPGGDFYGSSQVSAVSRGFQAGYTYSDTEDGSRAAFWHGSSSSWVDLHAILPTGFTSSVATGLSSDATTLYVSGYGFNTLTSRNEALLWTRPICCPADFNCSTHLEVQDIFDFLSAWFALDPRADFNAVNGITTQDIFDFLAAWFAGCS